MQKPHTTMSWQMLSQNLTMPRQPSHIMELVKSYQKATKMPFILVLGGGGGSHNTEEILNIYLGHI